MRRLAILIPLLLVAALACGGDDDDETPTPAATTAPPAATAATSPPAVATATPQQPAATATAAPTQAPTQAPTATPGGSEDAAAEAALDALTRWLGPVGDRGSMSVASAEAVTWANGCLEAAPPGIACTDALVEGYRFRIELANATYEVRTDADGDVAVWVPDVMILVRFSEAGPNIVEFTTDDGGTIVTQAVFGTRFVVEPSALSPGDPVGIALVDAPQSGGFLLVWMAQP